LGGVTQLGDRVADLGRGVIRVDDRILALGRVAHLGDRVADLDAFVRVDTRIFILIGRTQLGICLAHGAS
jgi:hypothetical protein